MSRIIFKFYIKELGILAVILISKSIFAQMENRFELRTGYYHAVDFAGGPQICISHQAKIFSKDIYTFISWSYSRMEKEWKTANYEIYVFSGRGRWETWHNYFYEIFNVSEISAGIRLGEKMFFIPEILQMKVGSFTASGWGYILGVEYPVSEKVGINMYVKYNIINKPFYPEISDIKITEFCGIGFGLTFIKN